MISKPYHVAQSHPQETGNEQIVLIMAAWRWRHPKWSKQHRGPAGGAAVRAARPAGDVSGAGPRQF